MSLACYWTQESRHTPSQSDGDRPATLWREAQGGRGMKPIGQLGSLPEARENSVDGLLDAILR